MFIASRTQYVDISLSLILDKLDWCHILFYSYLDTGLCLPLILVVKIKIIPRNQCDASHCIDNTGKSNRRPTDFIPLEKDHHEKAKYGAVA